MKKMILLALCAIACGYNAQAQKPVTGFCKKGNVDFVAKMIGVTISYSKVKNTNGGKDVKFEYKNIETSNPYQTGQTYKIDSFKSGEATGYLVANGPITGGSQDISGVNLLIANDTALIAIRYLTREEAGTDFPIKTTYTFTSNRAVREAEYADKHVEKEQVLP